jgi:hypothetical protein
MTPGRGRFLRDNAFLVAAVSLPLVVVGFFLISSAIPRWTVPPPAYDLLLRADGPYHQSPSRVVVDYRVRDGRVEAVVGPLPANSYGQPSTLWLFDHKTMNVSRVSTCA